MNKVITTGSTFVRSAYRSAAKLPRSEKAPEGFLGSAAEFVGSGLGKVARGAAKTAKSSPARSAGAVAGAFLGLKLASYAAGAAMVASVGIGAAAGAALGWAAGKGLDLYNKAVKREDTDNTKKFAVIGAGIGAAGGAVLSGALGGPLVSAGFIVAGASGGWYGVEKAANAIKSKAQDFGLISAPEPSAVEVAEVKAEKSSGWNIFRSK